MRPTFYDYDYTGYVAKPLDYCDPNAPINIRRKCDCCGYNLGLQDSGYTCSRCKYIRSQINK